MTATDLLSQALLPESIQAGIDDLMDKIPESHECPGMEVFRDIAELAILRRDMMHQHNAAAHELFRARKQTIKEMP